MLFHTLPTIFIMHTFKTFNEPCKYLHWGISNIKCSRDSNDLSLKNFHIKIRNGTQTLSSKCIFTLGNKVLIQFPVCCKQTFLLQTRKLSIRGNFLWHSSLYLIKLISYRILKEKFWDIISFNWKFDYPLNFRNVKIWLVLINFRRGRR